MTVLHPCLHCHRKASCEIKRDALKQIRGIGITKAKLRCKIPEQDFPPGSIVSVCAFELRPGFYGDDGPAKATIHRTGVVSRWRGGEALVILNKDQEIMKFFDETDRIGLLHATSDRLTRVGDALVDLCSCGLPATRCMDDDMPRIRTGDWVCPEKIVKDFR